MNDEFNDSWNKLLSFELTKQGESKSDLVYINLNESQMSDGFNADYDEACLPFIAYSANRIYFSHIYDSDPSVRSLPRNPSDKKHEHIGD